MFFRQCVMLAFCVAMAGCGGGPSKPSQAEIDAANAKMKKDMESMTKLPAKLETPGDPMKNMMNPSVKPK